MDDMIERQDDTDPRRRDGWLHEDRYLLEGPRSRTAEFIRLIRIAREFLRGFRSLHLLENRMIPEKTIQREDLDRFVLTDSAEEVVRCLERCPSRPHLGTDDLIQTRHWEMRHWNSRAK